MEPNCYSLPRDDFRADIKTDLFALGCTIYFILLSHEISPELSYSDKDASEKVEGRLAKKEWPGEQQVCNAVTVKCWEQQYESAEEVVRDLEVIEREHGGSSAAAMPGSVIGEVVAATGHDKPEDGSQ